MSVSIGPLVLYMASFVSTLSVKRLNRLIGEKVSVVIGAGIVANVSRCNTLQPEYLLFSRRHKG